MTHPVQTKKKKKKESKSALVLVFLFLFTLNCGVGRNLSASISAADRAEVNSSIPGDFLMSSFSETAVLLCVTGYFQ